MIRVIIPSQLESYTQGKREVIVDASACSDLQQLTRALDGLYPGIRFRFVDEHGNIRRHIAIFVGETMVRTLDTPLHGHERVQIVGALSGG